MGKIIQISAGHSHSLFLNEEGEIFGSGFHFNRRQNLIPIDFRLFSNNDWVLK
jgi:alpha-tubulin suppressor-like RCC1 family protein